MSAGKKSGKQFTIKRKITDMPIVAGGFNTVDLPRDYDYQGILLRLTASVQVSVAAATAVRAEAPCQAVPRIEILADGKNTLFSAPLWFAALANVDRPLGESGARAVTPPTGVAVATYAVEAIAMIDFQNFEGVRPKDSNFRSRGLSMFQARLTFGQAADMFVVGGATVAFTGSPVVSIAALQCVEDTDENGNYITSPIALKKVSYQSQTFASSNANAEVLLPAGNSIAKVTIRTDGLVTAGEPSAAVLNNVQLANGIDVRTNLSGAQLRALNNADYGQVQLGYYVVDPCKAGSGGNLKLTDMWDLSGATQPKAILDIVGGANVTAQVVTTEMILAQR